MWRGVASSLLHQTLADVEFEFMAPSTVTVMIYDMMGKYRPITLFSSVLCRLVQTTACVLDAGRILAR